MLGVLYAVLAAATFGFNNASARRGVISGTAIQGLAISMPMGLLTFAIGATLLGEWDQFSRMPAKNIGLLAAAGVLHFVWGRYFNMRSLAAIGSNLAGPVQQVQLLLSLSLAIIFLGETLTPLKVLGILLVVSAPAYILHRRRQDSLRAKDRRKNGAPPPPPAATAFTPRLAEGYTYALLAAAGFGSSGVLIKAGIGGTGLSFLGGVVAYGAAVAVVAMVICLPSQLRQVSRIRAGSSKWFVYSGIGVSLSQVFRFLALGLAPVTVVQPLQSLSLVFRMIFGYFINREHERFDAYVIVGIALSFAGAMALSVSDEILWSHSDLPGWLAELSRWKWP